MKTFDTDSLNAIYKTHGDEALKHKMFDVVLNGQMVPANRFNLSEGWVELTPFNDITGDPFYDKDGEIVEIRLNGEITFTGDPWWTDRIREYSA